MFYWCKPRPKTFFNKEEGDLNLGYVRVSTEEQNEGRQVAALEKYGIEKWYVEKVSGKNLDRPKLREMLDFSREGDTIFVLDWSRVSRSTKDLLALMDTLREKGVHLVSVKENFDTSTPTGRLMLTVMAAINEFERANMLERQREGIALAKRAGTYKGRPAKRFGDIGEAYGDFMARRRSKTEIARGYGISRPTLDRLFREYKESSE